MTDPLIHVEADCDGNEPREHTDGPDCWCGPITEVIPGPVQDAWMAELDELARRFNYHAPNEVTRETHQDLRTATRLYAEQVSRHLPDGREKALFLTNLEQASFWAHAAIARSQS